jgi:hypothetical protein
MRHVCAFCVLVHRCYFSSQATSAAALWPAASFTVALSVRQIAAPSLYWGLVPVTVYVPGGRVAVYFPSGPTVTCCVTGPAMVTVPGRGFGEAPAGPPTATRLPVSVAGLAGADAGAGDDADAGEEAGTDDEAAAGCACVDEHAARSPMAATARIARLYMGTTIEPCRSRFALLTYGCRPALLMYASRAKRRETYPNREIKRSLRRPTPSRRRGRQLRLEGRGPCAQTPTPRHKEATTVARAGRDP